MGISFSVDDQAWLGNERRVRITATFDASYTTGGEAIAPSDAGLDAIEHVDVLQQVTASGYVVTHDFANGKLVVYESADANGPMAEVAAADAGLDGETVALEVWGRS